MDHPAVPLKNQQPGEGRWDREFMNIGGMDHGFSNGLYDYVFMYALFLCFFSTYSILSA